MTEGSPEDARWLRYSFELARRSRESGDQPFAAVLVGQDGELVLEAMNSRNRERDIAAHADMTLVRQAMKAVPLADLPRTTLYASTEPCMMCAGVIAWSRIGTVVFGLSQVRLNAIPTTMPPRFGRPTRLNELLDGLVPSVAVRGPLLEEEAMAPHEGYWA